MSCVPKDIYKVCVFIYINMYVHYDFGWFKRFSRIHFLFFFFWLGKTWVWYKIQKVKIVCSAKQLFFLPGLPSFSVPSLKATAFSNYFFNLPETSHVFINIFICILSTSKLLYMLICALLISVQSIFWRAIISVYVAIPFFVTTVQYSIV